MSHDSVRYACDTVLKCVLGSVALGGFFWLAHAWIMKFRPKDPSQ